MKEKGNLLIQRIKLEAFNLNASDHAIIDNDSSDQSWLNLQMVECWQPPYKLYGCQCVVLCGICMVFVKGFN